MPKPVQVDLQMGQFNEIVVDFQVFDDRINRRVVGLYFEMFAGFFDDILNVIVGPLWKI